MRIFWSNLPKQSKFDNGNLPAHLKLMLQKFLKESMEIFNNTEQMRYDSNLKMT